MAININPIKVISFMWNFSKGLVHFATDTTREQLNDLKAKQVELETKIERHRVYDSSLERSNERLLAEDCHSIENHVTKKGLSRMCRKLKKDQLHQAQAIAEVNQTPTATRVCIEVLKMGLAIYMKAGPEGLAGGALNLICAKYL